MKNFSNYENTKNSAKYFYKKIGKIFSPALNRDIYFNSKGFNHIIFKKSRSERERSSQTLRFKLLRLAVKLIKISTTYQEFEEISKKEKETTKFRTTRYWGIIAIIEQRKIKVILKQCGDNGNIHFWSIIPAWTTNKYRDEKLYKTMKGTPEQD
ncbi:MAG: hypothetical protein K9L98_01180 [Candidatus Pacebacteria bacterium]|nr:hypothetical protein [Candidatus Paceibacterota bacterium]MCF7862604.1 hypothetical protein [Candidatus Paceibacterota bacterium]